MRKVKRYVAISSGQLFTVPVYGKEELVQIWVYQGRLVPT